jgi:hypothetical protein
MNRILFRSTLLCTFIHMYFVNGETSRVLVVVYSTGLCTSLWNHATTSWLAKNSDRLMMVSGVIFDVVYLNEMSINCIKKTYILLLLVLSIVNYFISTAYNTTLFHVYSHLTLTLCHYFLILFTV